MKCQKNDSNNYANATIIYIIANGIGQGTTLLSNIFFTRYMSKVDYGLYGNYYSYVSILASIVGANLYVALSNAYIDYRDDIKRFRSSILALSTIIFGVVSAVLLTAKFTIGIPLPTVYLLVALVHAYGFFVINYYMQSLNMENRYWRKGLFLCIPNVLQAALGIVGVLLVNTYGSKVYGSAIGIAICGIAGYILIISNEKLCYDKEYWRYALRISLPAVISSVACMIMQQLDKVMINEFVGPEETAIYSLTYNIGYILYAVLQATNGVWQVWFYNAVNVNTIERIKKVQKWYMYFMLFLATGLFMISPEIIKILSPRSYWQFDYVIPFVIGSYLMLMYNFNLTAAQYHKRTGAVSIMVSIGALVNMILNSIFVPEYGGVAAAWTSAISYLVILLISVCYAYVHKERYFSNSLYFVFGIAVLGDALVFHYVKDTILLRYLVFILLLFAEIALAYFKKNELLVVVKKELMGKKNESLSSSE